MSDVLRPGERYAGFWIRFVASVIDSIIVSIVIGPIAGALYEKPDATASIMSAAQSGDLLQLALALLAAMQPASVGDALLNIGLPAVGIVAFWIYRSATPGKMATRTRIVDASTGAAPDARQCIVRYLGYFVSILGFMLGFVWIAFDKRKQGWHDKLAGTVVIRSAAAR